MLQQSLVLQEGAWSGGLLAPAGHRQLLELCLQGTAAVLSQRDAGTGGCLGLQEGLVLQEGVLAHAVGAPADCTAPPAGRVEAGSAVTGRGFRLHRAAPRDCTDGNMFCRAGGGS